MRLQWPKTKFNVRVRDAFPSYYYKLYNCIVLGRASVIDQFVRECKTV